MLNVFITVNFKNSYNKKAKLAIKYVLIPSSYVKGAKRNSRCVADSKVA